MLDTAGKIWAKIQEFMGRIDKLEDDSKDTTSEVKHLKRELELLRRETQHDKRVTDKVQEQQGLKVVELEQRLKKVESEKRGKAISAGKAKAKLAKYEEDRRPSRH